MVLKIDPDTIGVKFLVVSFMSLINILPVSFRVNLPSPLKARQTKQWLGKNHKRSVI